MEEGNLLTSSVSINISCKFGALGEGVSLTKFYSSNNQGKQPLA